MLRHNTSDSTFKCNSDAATAYVLDQPTLAKFLKEHPSHSLEVILNHLCSCVCWVCCVVCCSVCFNIGGRTHTCALPPSSSLLLPPPSSPFVPSQVINNLANEVQRQSELLHPLAFGEHKSNIPHGYSSMWPVSVGAAIESFYRSGMNALINQVREWTNGRMIEERMIRMNE